MKVIIRSEDDGRIFIERVSEAHFKKAYRGEKFDDPSILDHDCDITNRTVQFCFDIHPTQARKLVRKRRR